MTDVLLDAELARRVLARALDRGGDWAEVYVEDRFSEAASTDDGRVERLTTGFQRGAGVRVISNGMTAFAFTEELTDAALFALVDRLGQLVRHAPAETAIVLPTEPLRAPARVEVAPDAVAKARRVAMLDEADVAARRVDPRIVQVSAFLGTIVQRILVANSDGVFAEDCRHRLRFRVQAIAFDQQRREIAIGTYAPGVTCGFELFERLSVSEIARRAAHQAVTLVEAAPAPARSMPVIIGRGVGGVLIHEACGHGLEADTVVKGASIYRDRLGTPVANPLVTILDDATLPGAWGSFGLDDEGVPAQRTVLVEEGRLRSYLPDRLSARQLGVAPTGNGRRASFRHIPIPRMSNTFIAPGEHSLDDLIGATPYGLYAKSLSGGSVNPANGSFEFTVREAYLVRNGRIDRPVRGATLVGNARDVLNGIDMIADDLEVVAANCGRDGQRAMVGLGQPSLRIREMTVGGTKIREQLDRDEF